MLSTMGTILVPRDRRSRLEPAHLLTKVMATTCEDGACVLQKRATEAAFGVAFVGSA